MLGDITTSVSRPEEPIVQPDVSRRNYFVSSTCWCAARGATPAVVRRWGVPSSKSMIFWRVKDQQGTIKSADIGDEFMGTTMTVCLVMINNKRGMPAALSTSIPFLQWPIVASFHQLGHVSWWYLSLSFFIYLYSIAQDSFIKMLATTQPHSSNLMARKISFITIRYQDGVSRSKLSPKEHINQRPTRNGPKPSRMLVSTYVSCEQTLRQTQRCSALLKILRSEDVTTPLQALALSTESKEWDFVQTQHTKTWEVDGVKGPVRCRCLWLVVKWDSNFAIGPLMENTQIQYQNFWFGRDQDASKYTLVLIGMFSPAGMVNDRIWCISSGIGLFRVSGRSRASIRTAAQKFPCPKQIIITSVVTESMRKILDRVRENLREEPEGASWPGDRFHPDSDAGRAILGTIHGRSLAWFLIQNKHQFGNKSFWSIYLFRREECNKTGGYQPWDYKLYFEIGYVQEQDATGGAEIS
ncbi:DNA replication licensing factor [Venturia nashicola]|nr:DNA replication licensing factor [Venturia nashicola]